MSQEGIEPAAAVNDVNIAQALMEEDLEKEISRNEAANKMALDREMAAMAARKRAEASQLQMQAMLAKYEDMRTKLDSTKKHLDDTTTRLEVQEKLTDKVIQMKARVEAYATKKEAVNALNEHVKIKQDLQIEKLEVVKESLNEESAEVTQEEKERYSKLKTDLEDNASRVGQLKTKMTEHEEVLAKKEELKKRLERAVELGEKKTAEQNRITEVREKMLELKLKELALQKARLARRKHEQEEKERATNDFFDAIDKQLDDMNSMETNMKEENKKTGTVPKQKQNKSKGKGKKSKSSTPNVMSPKVMSPEPCSMPAETDTITDIESKKHNKIKKSPLKDIKVNEIDLATAEEEKDQANNSKVDTLDAHNTKDDKANSENVDKIDEEKNNTKVDKANSENVDKIDEEKTEAEALIKEQFENMTLEVDTTNNDTKMTEEEVKATVARIEGKVKNVRGDIADMAVSEQYLRTKQALLMAKKKEKEMQIAQNIAELRETEVEKMREKVKQMQELLLCKRQKLKTTEEIMEAKNEEKKAIDKQIEKTKRRENYLDNEKIDRVIFEKEPSKKK